MIDDLDVIDPEYSFMQRNYETVLLTKVNNKIHVKDICKNYLEIIQVVNDGGSSPGSRTSLAVCKYWVFTSYDWGRVLLCRTDISYSTLYLDPQTFDGDDTLLNALRTAMPADQRRLVTVLGSARDIRLYGQYLYSTFLQWVTRKYSIWKVCRSFQFRELR